MNDSFKDLQDWNRIADNYTKISDPENDNIYQQFKDVLWDCLGDISGLKVLDLGCGSGWLSKLMVESGATVHGIDGSSELLKRARDICPQVEFIEHDLSHGLPEDKMKFDRIVAHMVLMDIPDIDELIKSVRHLIQKNGKFIFTMTHPCFFNFKSKIDPGTGELSCRVTGYLQPVEWWIDS